MLVICQRRKCALNLSDLSKIIFREKKIIPSIPVFGQGESTVAPTEKDEEVETETEMGSSI